MGLVRNDFGEVRVAPTLDYTGVPADGTVDVSCRVSGCREPGHPEENVYHWVAGGWTPLSRYPVPEALYPNHRNDPLAYPVAAAEPDAPPPVPENAAVRGEAGPEVAGLTAGQAVAPPTSPAPPAPAGVPAAPEGAAK